MLKQKHNKTTGFTLIEIVVYVTLVALLTGLAVGSLIFLNIRLTEFSISREIDNTAQIVMEKLVREIRFADSVDVFQSTFGSTPGTLVLDSTDVAGTPTVIEFSTNNGTLEFYRDSVLVGPLTPQDVSIDELIFDHIVTARGQAVKIGLLLSGSRRSVLVEESFSTTVLLRGSY